MVAALLDTRERLGGRFHCGSIVRSGPRSKGAQLTTEDKDIPKKRGRPSGKPSVEARVVDACIKYWMGQKAKHVSTLKGFRIPEAGMAELLLLGPTEGTLVVIVRTWPHAAAFAHIVGQAIGDIAHLMHCAPAGGRALMEGNDPSPDPAGARKLGARLVDDATAGKLGLVFAIGFTDRDGDEPVRKRLLPVLELLDRWASMGVPGLELGVHLWAVRLGEGEEEAKVEIVPLRPPGRSQKEG